MEVEKNRTIILLCSSPCWVHITCRICSMASKHSHHLAQPTFPDASAAPLSSSTIPLLPCTRLLLASVPYSCSLQTSHSHLSSDATSSRKHFLISPVHIKSYFSITPFKWAGLSLRTGTICHSLCPLGLAQCLAHNSIADSV